MAVTAGPDVRCSGGPYMRWSITLLFAAIGAISVPADDQPDWKEFASREGRFQVLMPGTPKQYKVDAESDFGKGVLHLNVVEAGNTMYGELGRASGRERGETL